ncbi:MAG: ATP-binding protein [Acidobacteriota bacterium]
MKRFLLVPLIADEVSIARYQVQAAHSRPGEEIAVDLRTTHGFGDGLGELVHEFATTAGGNGQSLSVLTTPEGLPDGLIHDSIPRFTGLEECLSSRLGMPDSLPCTVQLTLPTALDDLPPLRKYLASVQAHLVADEDSMPVEMLVDEVCQNAIENSPSNRNHFEVCFMVEETGVRIEVSNISDDSIVPERIMKKRLDSFDDSGTYLGERGRGLFLIARLADDLQIRTDDERITVIVSRRFGSASP